MESGGLELSNGWFLVGKTNHQTAVKTHLFLNQIWKTSFRTLICRWADRIFSCYGHQHRRQPLRVLMFPTQRQVRSCQSPNNHIVKLQSSFCLFKLDSPQTCCWILVSGSDSLPSLWIWHCCCLMHDITEVNWSVEIPSHESHVKPPPDVVSVVETS